MTLASLLGRKSRLLRKILNDVRAKVQRISSSPRPVQSFEIAAEIRRRIDARQPTLRSEASTG